MYSNDDTKVVTNKSSLTPWGEFYLLLENGGKLLAMTINFVAMTFTSLKEGLF